MKPVLHEYLMYMKFFKRLFLMLGLVGFLWLSSGVEAQATRLTQARLRYDRMKAGQQTGMQLLVVPASTATEAKIKIVFGTGVSVPSSGVTSNTSPLDSGLTAMPGALTVTSAGTSMIIAVSDLTVGTTYALNISGAGVTTPGAAGVITETISTLTSGDAVIDSTSIASRFIADDQIVITANVPPTFTFVLSGNTDAFTADLSSGSVVSTNGRTVTVTTNAAKGWTGWVKSANAGLSSVTTGESIGTSGVVNGSPTTCGAGGDCYVLDADLTTSGAGGGSLAIAGEYNGGDTNSGGTLSTAFQQFATRTGKTDGDVITLIARATMIATKAAGSDYTDTLTVIGAGNF